MFVDTAKVKLQAGKGGDGAVSFRHEIYIPKGGPDGGDGGRGGSIIFRADKDTNTLLDFRFNPELKAEDGKNGSGQRSAGRSGRDLIVEVPIGTVVRKIEKIDYNKDDLYKNTANLGPILADLDEDKKEAVIAKGGDGGFGNAHFKSSTRQAPIIAEVGEPGDEFEVSLELKLLADVGLVGLPNAGKSTFLSVVSNARPEIADYPFTTLTPQLGVATIDEQDILIADIPGLIEGAADGKGLGYDFLRHVDRTAALLHLIDVYNNDAGEAYRTIRGELERYAELGTRPEIVALTKCESVDQDILEMQIKAILEVNPEAQIYSISSSAHQGLNEVLRALISLKQENDKVRAQEAVKSAEQAARLAQENVDSEEDGFLVGDEFGELDGSNAAEFANANELPVIGLTKKAISRAWKVEKVEDKFVVSGAKIEKFARRTDYANYASLNRLRDIMKKMGIRAELTSQGAQPDSIIEIAGHEFTLVEDY